MGLAGEEGVGLAGEEPGSGASWRGAREWG